MVLSFQTADAAKSCREFREKAMEKASIYLAARLLHAPHIVKATVGSSQSRALTQPGHDSIQNVGEKIAVTSSLDTSRINRFREC